MNRFEDFIKENAKLNSNSTKEELEYLKSLNKRSLFNLKVFWGVFVASAAFSLALFIFNSPTTTNESVSDSVAENYVIEVFLAVDEEISDSEAYEEGIL